MVLSTAALCLALNIYHEARGEPVIGQKAVAQVTMNRAGGDPDKVCDVVFAPYQFSWANPLTLAPSQEVRVQRAEFFMPKDETAWTVAKILAVRAIEGSLMDVVGNADHYYNPRKANPRWARKMEPVARVGNHRFLQSK